MSIWKDYKLGEVLAPKGYIRGPFGSSLKRDEMKEDGVPVYEQKNAIYNSREFRFFIDDNKFEELKRFQVRANDLIISCSGTVGKISVIKDEDPKGIISQALLILRPNLDKISLKYLYYFLSSRQGFELITQASHGSVQINIAERKVVENIPLNLPEPAEQKTITDILSSLDDKIDLLHRQNKTLEAMAETLFRQWFIVEAKEDWEEKPLKEVCVIRNGYAFQSHTYTETGQVILRTLNFSDHWIELNSMVYISDELAKSFEKFYLKRNDFLLVMVGASLGNFAIITKDVLPALQNQNMWCFRAKEHIPQHYLNFVLRQLIKESLHGASGSARDFFQKGVFYELLIVVPPHNLMKRFEVVSEDYFSKIELNRIQIKTLEKLRDTLWPKLMSGEVRVSCGA